MTCMHLYSIGYICIITLLAYDIRQYATATVALELNTFVCLKFVAYAEMILLDQFGIVTLEHD